MIDAPTAHQEMPRLGAAYKGRTLGWLVTIEQASTCLLAITYQRSFLDEITSVATVIAFRFCQIHGYQVWSSFTSLRPCSIIISHV